MQIKFTSGYIGLKRKEYGNEDIERPWEDLAKHISNDDEIEPQHNDITALIRPRVRRDSPGPS